jgi:hypothetical protein
MPTTYRGGCQCRAIRYEIAAEPMITGQCQCLHCQHETGGGHAALGTLPVDRRIGEGHRRYRDRAHRSNPGG